MQFPIPGRSADRQRSSARRQHASPLSPSSKKGKGFPYSLSSVGPELIPVYRPYDVAEKLCKAHYRLKVFIIIILASGRTPVIVSVGTTAAEVLLDLQRMRNERVPAERIHVSTVSQGILAQRPTHWFVINLKRAAQWGFNQ